MNALSIRIVISATIAFCCLLNATASEVAVSSTDDTRIRDLIPRLAATDKEPFHIFSFPVNGEWVDFTVKRSLLHTKTNVAKEQIPLAAILEKSKKEVMRLFPDTSGWIFESVTLKHAIRAKDRFRDGKRQGERRKDDESELTREVNIGDMWVYLVEWSRVTEKDVDVISVPVLLSGESIKGRIRGGR